MSRRPTFASSRAIALFLVVGASGCASGSGDGGDPVDRSEYPGDPYGVSEGDVIADLAFETPEGEAFALSDVYENEDNKLLLLSTAAGWCAPCREEQPALEERYGEWKEKGLAVVVAIFEDSNYEEPTSEFVAQWRDQYALTFDVVRDASFVLEPYYNADLTPMNMFVDVDSMEILRIQTGFDASAVDALIESQLD